MIDRVKLDEALQRQQRSSRYLLVAALGLTFAAVIDGCVAVASGPLMIVLDVFIFFGAAVEWACYLSVRSTANALKAVQDAIREEGQ
jgi:hypothetical protein